MFVWILGLVCSTSFIFAQLAYGGPRVAKLPLAIKRPKAPDGPQTAILVEVGDVKAPKSSSKKKTIQAAIHDPPYTTHVVDWDHDVVGVAEFDCPNGFGLVDDRCVQVQYRDPLLSCPYGAFRNKLGQCVQVDNVPPERVCPSGFEYYMKGCIRRSTRSPVVFCANGFVNMGSICVQPSSIPPIRTCPIGFVEDAVSTMCIRKIVDTVKVRCRETELLTDDGRCLSTVEFVGETVCPDQYTIAKSINGNSSECAKIAEYVGNVTCPDGYSLVLPPLDNTQNHIPLCHKDRLGSETALPNDISDGKTIEKDVNEVLSYLRHATLSPPFVFTRSQFRGFRGSGNRYLLGPSNELPDVTEPTVTFERSSCNSQDLKLIDWTDPLRPVCTEIHTVDVLTVCDSNRDGKFVCKETNFVELDPSLSPQPLPAVDDAAVNDPDVDDPDVDDPAVTDPDVDDPDVDDSDVDAVDTKNAETMEPVNEESVSTPPELLNQDIKSQLIVENSNIDVLEWDDLYPPNQVSQMQEIIGCRSKLGTPTCQVEHYSTPEKWCSDGFHLLETFANKGEALCEKIERVAPVIQCPLGVGEVSKSGMCETLLTAPQSVSCSEGYDSAGDIVADPNSSICQRVEYADYQSVCPSGYERDGPRHDTKACVAEKIVPPTWICEPGFWLVDDSTNRCKKTVVVAPSMVPAGPQTGKEGDTEPGGPATVCMLTEMAALSCGAERRYFATPSRRGYKQGLLNQQRVQIKQNDHLKKY